jgi:hypothetical protein
MEQIDKRKLFLFLMLIYGVATNATDVFEEDDELQMPPAVVASPNRFPIPMTHVQSPRESNICHVEYTVLKKSTGHCVKIGKGMRACIAGAYFHPYHPDCI